MRKTYRNLLPKNMEVQNTNVRIENGELVVEVEFKEKFEPKDGDFLCSNGDCFIYNGKQSELSYGAYVGFMRTLKRTPRKITEDYWAVKENCRYATPEEKTAFLARLEKECHKRWNEEIKQLEDIRWRAKENENYWVIDEVGNVLFSKENCTVLSDSRHLYGNYFKTKEAAQKVADQIKEIFKNSKAK